MAGARAVAKALAELVAVYRRVPRILYVNDLGATVGLKFTWKLRLRRSLQDGRSTHRTSEQMEIPCYLCCPPWPHVLPSMTLRWRSCVARAALHCQLKLPSMAIAAEIPCRPCCPPCLPMQPSMASQRWSCTTRAQWRCYVASYGKWVELLDHCPSFPVHPHLLETVSERGKLTRTKKM